MPNNHSNTDVVGPEILACSGGHGTHQFAPPSVEKFGLENARKAFAKASKISHPVTTLAAGNLFMLETDEHVIVDSGGEECISAGNIWRVNRLDRRHDPVMVDPGPSKSELRKKFAPFGGEGVSAPLAIARPCGDRLGWGLYNHNRDRQ
ncbi:hypothetical protein GNZ13_08595 [Paraburkholderia sp. 5N]|uniref:Uncharacterized protein n=1 Tax=Paraburkholderia elongata TaxID=2675747 RepID=A0A972NNB1_9BURK|nr:hypothetical protein [Paraburkholderia elongata]